MSIKNLIRKSIPNKRLILHKEYQPLYAVTEQNGKPGSVLYESIIIYLGPLLPKGSRDLTRKLDGPPNTFLCGLAPDGVYLAGLLPNRRCALTAPFHPYLSEERRFISVALSLKSPPPAVSRHPALRCPDFPQTGPFETPLAMIHFTPLCYYIPKCAFWQALLQDLPIRRNFFCRHKFHLRHGIGQFFHKRFHGGGFGFKMPGIDQG